MSDSASGYRRVSGVDEIGAFASRLGDTNWRVRAPGFIDPRHLIATRALTAGNNVLSLVDKIPQAIVDTLTANDLQRFLRQAVISVEALQWHQSLPPHPLFTLARETFRRSTEELLAGRFGPSRWASRDALGSTLLGLLVCGGTPVKTAGIRGHNLFALTKLLRAWHGLEVPDDFIALCDCLPTVRETEDSTDSQALNANIGVLLTFDSMRRSPKIDRVLQPTNDHGIEIGPT